MLGLKLQNCWLKLARMLITNHEMVGRLLMKHYGEGKKMSLSIYLTEG
jgi:hypothetical protein